MAGSHHHVVKFDSDPDHLYSVIAADPESAAQQLADAAHSNEGGFTIYACPPGASQQLMKRSTAHRYVLEPKREFVARRVD